MNEPDESWGWVQRNVVVRLDREPSASTYVQTDGLSARGFYELEIRGIMPGFLRYEAGDLLNRIATYMVRTGHAIQPGERYQYDDGPVLTFVETAVPGRLRVEEAPLPYDAVMHIDVSDAAEA